MSTYMRKYDIDVGNKTMFRMGMVPVEGNVRTDFVGRRRLWRKSARANTPTN